MRSDRILNVFALVLSAVAVVALFARNLPAKATVQLLNVSYDPTRELYAKLNPAFIASYAKATNTDVEIKQAHGGSSRQARAIIAKDLPADVVTLGLSPDIELLNEHALVAEDWRSRLPHDAQPYYSTIVFVVRKGNPLGIHDWPDLIEPDVEIITPDPRSSGNGKLSALAAWGAIVKRGGSEDDAKAYLKKFYEHTPFLELGARSATTAFAVEKLGHVHVAWENEALREVAASSGELEVVYPPLSIRAEPVVAWVDANVKEHGTEAVARAYLEFLFSEPAQQIIATSGYRPVDERVAAREQARFGRLELFPITDIAKDWQDAQRRFFSDTGIIDTVYQPKPR